ncbi:ribosome recycling factor [Candidatus Hodgkinia cicadicola]|nr:ribosome recycling factor [Candidatus Hodgkinia cicadicola]
MRCELKLRFDIMLSVIELARLRALTELQQIVSRFKLKASCYFVDKITIGMISHLKLSDRSLGASCGFRQCSNGGLELAPFERASVKRVADAIKLAKLGLYPEVKLETVYVPLPTVTSNRRGLVLKSLFLMLEQFKLNVRAVRRRALTHLKTFNGIESDIKRVYLKRVESDVSKALFDLQQVYELNKRRLSLN